MRCCLVGVCLFFSSLVFAQEKPYLPLTVAKEIVVKTGRGVRIGVETTAKELQWSLSGSTAHADLFACKDNQAIFVADRPGRYQVYVIGKDADQWTQLTSIWVLVEAEIPPKPIPDPPKPKDDPVPAPPIDPLLASFKKLYQQDDSKTKQEDLKQLIELYRMAIGYAKRSDVTTVHAFLQCVRTASFDLLDMRLSGIRNLVRDELAKELPQTGSDQLTPALRQKIEAMLERFITLLEGVV